LRPPPELFRALPGTARRFPWLSLGAFPTRVERVAGLLPPSVELWLKREDESDSAYGGNKVRKLEFLLGDARARGFHRVVTFGGTGSHHVAATAIHGARAGFEVEALLVPQPADAHVRELLLAEQAAGAQLLGLAGYLALVPARLLAHAKDGCWLAGGGSSPRGTLGWVSGGLEILAQVRSGELPSPDVVYAALGSCGTVAGLWLGLRGARPPEIVGVRVVGGPACGEVATRLLAARTARLLGELLPGEAPRLRVEPRFLGAGYGHPSGESIAAVALAARYGIALDPIYTGKVMAALLDDARAGRLEGKRVLFLHSFSSVDLRPLAARASPDRLPPRLRSIFEERA
jgi:1-aminocyclopropane-1-carboxylate deaminase/D-cysteine desulfhydrase-like pyridoxal-dependent ACC family enzyme